ncbi:hypothetical protein E2562_015298 [Oryza meyeriana var. granulata]|uniref:Uncharacterized protein n=1 Tax=Oryza meyeriana var. granulata TaxID=110450 RepID=A0A6G1DKH6_9ORYZ|nr:hypothetical protein E2562_015298 [Oryza meyeriana var. granulata]
MAAVAGRARMTHGKNEAAHGMAASFRRAQSSTSVASSPSPPPPCPTPPPPPPPPLISPFLSPRWMELRFRRRLEVRLQRNRESRGRDACATHLLRVDPAMLATTEDIHRAAIELAEACPHDAVATASTSVTVEVVAAAAAPVMMMHQEDMAAPSYGYACYENKEFEQVWAATSTGRWMGMSTAAPVAAMSHSGATDDRVGASSFELNQLCSSYTTIM